MVGDLTLGESAVTFKQLLQGRIAFVSRGDQGEHEICVIQADGSGRMCLTRRTLDESWCECMVAWSPDARQIAFTSHRDGNYEIYVMNADGSAQKRLTYSGHTSYGPAWSPDGKQIAFTSNKDWNTVQVYVLDADGTNQKCLTVPQVKSEHFSRGPTWSPDGKQIGFTSNRDGIEVVYLMNADGSDQKRIAEADHGFMCLPQWSPDGIQFVFVGRKGIFLIDALGTNLRQLTTHGPMGDWNPRWSPDGKFIVYESRVEVDMQTMPPKAGHTELFVLDVATSQSLRLTMTDMNNEYPSWTR
jgi:tol-pal system beta propeller repeat protein TolB